MNQNISEKYRTDYGGTLVFSGISCRLWGLFPDLLLKGECFELHFSGNILFPLFWKKLVQFDTLKNFLIFFDLPRKSFENFRHSPSEFICKECDKKEQCFFGRVGLKEWYIVFNFSSSRNSQICRNEHKLKDFGLSYIKLAAFSSSRIFYVKLDAFLHGFISQKIRVF